MQFSGHHSCFRKDFQMVLAVNKGEIMFQYCALGHTGTSMSVGFTE